MKFRSLVAGIPFLLVTLAAGTASAQSPRGKAEGKIGSANLAIDYGRPLLKGRDVMSLVVPGQLWRLGADDNTTVVTSAALEMGGKRIPAGKYTLAMRFVEKEKWHLLFLSKGDAFAFDPAGVAAEAPARLEVVSTPSEQLTLSVEKGMFQMLWGNRKATVPLTAGK